MFRHAHIIDSSIDDVHIVSADFDTDGGTLIFYSGIYMMRSQKKNFRYGALQLAHVWLAEGGTATELISVLFFWKGSDTLTIKKQIPNSRGYFRS